MESDTMTSQVPPAAPQAAGKVAAPLLNYARSRRFARLRRWLRPGSPVFFLLVLALAAGGTWGAWKLWLKMDERAFNARATIDSIGQIVFFKPPTAAALRHLARIPGLRCVGFRWSDDADTSAIAAFRGRRLRNVVAIWIRGGVNVDALLKELARPDTGLNALTYLDLTDSRVTDAGLKELACPDSDLKALAELYIDSKLVTDAGLKQLAGPDSGLKALTKLNLYSTPVTDAGLAQLARPDTGLVALRWLELGGTQVTDAGLKELARPDSGLKALTDLDLRAFDRLGRPLNQSKVTDAGLAALKKARPGLTVQK